ncbi:MAG TPA: phosphoribosylformylglycinamidine synthase subunit PurL [Rhodospirillaceae bacterium]|nr:phosphoribosylformylglycinamidine synthase subunit PurL [Rhodospirillaceae bacterium]
MASITKKDIKSHGLTDEEYGRILEILGGRIPNIVELGIFSVMWSEHCSYKSSKKWLKTLPTSAPWVICGPGENAGVIDIGQGLAAIFKMESHNHPSYIEPYQGAATGVGGILRDVFTMGARPIANMNALRFGSTEHHKTRHLVSGVIAGIGDYGNCVGVPTVGGEINFHSSYDGNILVNAMTVGVANKNNIFYSAASGSGNPVVYVGSKTGRDGIHGATMASAEFGDDAEEKRPTVQVGDPFTEKLLIEACLELMATDTIVAIQDMGAAGLTSSSFEMASKGRVGVELYMNKVPTREEGMTPYEIMLSESQERMLMVLQPGKEDIARRIFDKWELDFAVIGTLTDTGRMVLKLHDDTVADLPIDPLAQASPEYDRPWVPTLKQPALAAKDVKVICWTNALKILMGCPDLASRRWVWEQYDHMVMADTAQRPGGNAAVVRLHKSNRALAITTDCTPRYVNADPFEGSKQAVAESWRNITAVGGKPMAITDNLNFGNPEKPEIMGQIVEAIKGIGAACNELGYPVISGNVSLYNETDGNPILPTPAIGGVGLIDNIDNMATLAFKKADDAILLIGHKEEMEGWLGQSLYLREICNREDGAPPPVDLAYEKSVGDFIRNLILAGRISACHDLSDGGLLIALTEMALAGNIGCTLFEIQGYQHSFLFGEDQGRYVVTAKENDVNSLHKEATQLGIPIQKVGSTGGNSVAIGTKKVELTTLRSLNENWFPSYMTGKD